MPSALTWSDERSRKAETTFVVVFALWLARPFLTPGRYVIAFDTLNYSIPNHVVTMDAWRAGRLPLWNDLIFGGTPHLGNSQTAALYPVRLLTWGMEPTRAINLLIAGHLVLLALGMLVLARRLDMRPPAGAVVAIVGVAGGAMMSRSIQFEQICVWAWAPWVLIGVHDCFTSPRPLRAIAATAAASAAVVLAGHPQSAYMVGALGAGWTVLVAVSTNRLRRCVAVVGAGALAGCVAALQLAATIAATRASAIAGGRSLDELRQPELSVTARRLAVVLLGSVSDRNLARSSGGFEAIGYLGVAVAVLVIAGVVSEVRFARSAVIPLGLAAAGLGCITLALGPSTMLFRAAYRVVPGFDLGRVSARWLTPAALCAALLCGYAVSAAHDRRLRPAMTAIWVGLVGGALAVFDLAGRFEPLGRRLIATWILIAALCLLALYAAVRSHRFGALALATLVTLELGAMTLHSVAGTATATASASGRQRATTQYLDDQAGWTVSFTDDSAAPAYAVPGLRPNANVLAGIRSLDGYDGGVQVTERWLAMIATVNPQPSFALPLRNQLPLPLTPNVAASLNLRFVVVDNVRDVDALLSGWGPAVATDQQFSVFANPRWTGEAHIGTQSSDLERSSPERFGVRVSGPGGILDVDAQAAPGWRATIDGRSVPLADGDGFRLAVEVPSGSHTVEFRYRPWWLWPSASLSIIGSLGCVGLIAIDRRRQRRIVDTTITTATE